MARDWQVACKECGQPLLYSDRSRTEAVARGQSPPERCIKCRTKHSREISRLAVKYLDMEPGIPLPAEGLKTGRLGRLARPDRPHSEREVEGFSPPPPDTFGIQDDEIVKLLEALEGVQVAVIVAGTGSGKSTFLPWRLLVPPAPFPEDHLTRYGKIVVTQPRIEASTGIPQYVAQTLHGSVAGPGTDIGYENSKNKDKSDSRNKLVYLTDGTLVNMIRKGALHEVSTVIIDEAHERSLNIDLILALLRRELHGLPHLKVLIVSATIDTDTFKNFFEPDFPVLVVPMRSKGIHPVHERWWAGSELPVSSWPAQMPGRAAETVTEILRWMVDGTRPRDIPGEVNAYQGDILVFLTGKKPIEEAIQQTRELIEADPGLSATADTFELLPLYSELPEAQRRRALDPRRHGGQGTKSKSKYRIVYSTNLAETSLTIEGVRHVVDTGLINRKRWDPVTATESMEQVPHSQHGLRQRRGRAGRTHPGIWHCLYTEAQFAALESDTPPEITRAPLPAVVLAAAVAGVSDPASLTWLAPGPPAGEVSRALVALRAVGAIDENGDPTPVGRELAATRTSFEDAAILVTADQAGCAIEAATVLAAKSDGVRNQLLRWSRRWPATAKVHVDNVHQALLAGSVDDVDVVCRIWTGWESQPDRDRKLAWARRFYIDAAVMETLETERRKLLEPLMPKTRSSQVRPLDLRLLHRLRAAIAWANPNSLYIAQRGTSSDERLSTIASLTPTASPRSDQAIVAAMHTAARPALDDESWVSRHLLEEPACLVVLLDRQVRNRFTTPLAPPERLLQATFCVVVDPSLIFSGDDWLAAVSHIPLAPAACLPSSVPGDRFLADLLPAEDGVPSQLRLLAALPPSLDPTVEVEDDGDWREDEEDHDELTIDVGGRSDAALEAALDQVQPDDDETTDNDAALKEPTISAAQTLLDLRAELDDAYRDGAPVGSFEVVVTAVNAAGVLTCIPDTRVELFAAFVKDNLGRSVTLRLDEVRVFPRDREPVLLARHADSAFTTAIDPRHIGTGLRYPQLRALAGDASWNFELLAADQEWLVPELSQTDATVRALTRLAADRSPFRTEAKIVDVYLDTIFLQITPDAVRVRDEDPPLVFRAFARELPQAPDRIRLGASVSIALSWTSRRRETVPLGEARTFRLPSGPWEVHGGELAATAPLTAADWRRLIDFSGVIEDVAGGVRFRSHVSRLATRTLSPKVRVIDEQLFAATVNRGRTDAQVVEVLHDGALKVLTPLGEQVIGAGEAALYRALGNTTTVSSSLPIFVDRADADFAALNVRLFDPTERGRLAVGAVIDTRVGNRTASGREVHIHTLTGVEGLARIDSLRPGTAEGDVVPMRVVELPTDGLVRFSGRTVHRRVTISSQLAAVIQPAQQGRSGWDLRPFTTLSEVCDVSVDGNPPIRVDIYGDPTIEGQRAVDTLVAALTGPLWQIAVPHHYPLRENHREGIRSISLDTGCALVDGKRKNERGFLDNFVWVAAPSAAAAASAVDRVSNAYPQVWMSDWFKRKSAEWSAATQAVKARSGRMRSYMGFDVNRRPIFRVIIECAPGEETALLAAARMSCPSIPSGTFTTDPSIAATELTQSPAPSEIGVSPAPAVTRPAPEPARSVATTPPQPRGTERPQPRTTIGSGATVEEAIRAGCAELRVDPRQVSYVVIDEGKRGIFVRRPARVQITAQ